MMKQNGGSKPNGFTLIEVSLVLAISGLLLVGIIGLTNASIARNRFMNVSEDLEDYLKNIYSEVIYPRGSGDGNSDNKLILGKLVTFNELDSEKNMIRTYTVVSEGLGENADMTLSRSNLKNLKLSVMESNGKFYEKNEYKLEEGNYLTVNYKEGQNVGRNLDEKYPSHLAILILRSPSSGNVRTFTTANTGPAQTPIRFSTLNKESSDKDLRSNTDGNDGAFLAKLMTDADIRYFCLDSDDAWANGGKRRRFVIKTSTKLIHGNNSSDIELLSDADTTNGGNLCN